MGYRIAFVTLLIVAFAGLPVPMGTCQPSAMTVEELGSVGKPATVTTRDGGAMARIGDKLLWTFGDTLFNPKSVDGVNLRANTAALADLPTPLQVIEPTDANGAPYPLLPFTPDESAYNEAHRAQNERIALWPSSVIADGTHGYIFYLKLDVKPGFLNYEFIGTGMAEIKAGETTAVREPNLLFTVPEPTFDNAFLDGTTVYLYGSLGEKQEGAFGVARVALAQIRERTAYQFWDGSGWSPDVAASKPVITGIPGGLSVSYNPLLKQYLAIHSEILSNRIVMQTADAPTGTWSKPIVLFSGLAPKENVDYAAREHPELASPNGKTIYVSYYRPLGLFQGQLRLVRVGLSCG